MTGSLRRIALMAAVIAIAATPALAQNAPKAPPKDNPTDNPTTQTEKAFRESVEMILKALEKLVNSVPLYEAPEVLKNGDIIIRRKHPEKPPVKKKNDKSSDTSRT